MTLKQMKKLGPDAATQARIAAAVAAYVPGKTTTTISASGTNAFDRSGPVKTVSEVLSDLDKVMP